MPFQAAAIAVMAVGTSCMAAPTLQARVSKADGRGNYMVQFAERFIRSDDPSFAKEKERCFRVVERAKRPACYTQGRVGEPDRWLIVRDSAMFLLLDPAKMTFSYSRVPTLQDQTFSDGSFAPDVLAAAAGRPGKRPAAILAELANSEKAVSDALRDYFLSLADRAVKRKGP